MARNGKKEGRWSSGEGGGVWAHGVTTSGGWKRGDEEVGKYSEPAASASVNVIYDSIVHSSRLGPGDDGGILLRGWLGLVVLPD